MLGIARSAMLGAVEAQLALPVPSWKGHIAKGSEQRFLSGFA